LYFSIIIVPIPVVARSKAARLLGLWVRILQGHVGLSLVFIFCCQVEVFATGQFLAQKRTTEGVCVCVCVSFSMNKCNNKPLCLQW